MSSSITRYFTTVLPASADGAAHAAYSDPFLNSYWHLMATVNAVGGANVERVWDDFRGAGVVVGVIDDGIDYTHPELAANYDFALDYDSRDLDFDAYPADPGDRHGTTVAGVIAGALDNGLGGAGVAPEATVTGYRMGFGSNGSYQQVLGAFEWMTAVDVANNSWSFDGFLSDNFFSPFYDNIGDALHTAVDSGRGGLGTVVVFAAGNGRLDGQNVNYHNLQNDRGTIAVAAIDSGGYVTFYSTPGAALLVSAPGHGISTTDRVGALGYSSGDYATMNGTSFAAPLVSGVVALMLEANPGLGWRDVQEILASTAVQTGLTTGWSFNGADNWNGGGMRVNHDYGFGLVDAYAAVRVAESWRGVSTSANEWVASSGVAFVNAAIPDVGSITRTLALPDGLRIDHVEIDIDLQHANIGQLQIVLTSPDGTQSVLFDTPPTAQSDIFFTFSSTRDWGESSGGSWTLTVVDTLAGTSGVLNAWALRAYGDLVGDDTYVYTDDFATLATADPTRLQLTDDGGVDTINTAAIDTDTVLDLRPGRLLSIAGQSVTLASGTVIENLDSGDGNDLLIGNDVANSLRGWRGDDVLDGGAGADTLIGGPGDDRYYVDDANDVVVELAGEGTDRVDSSVSWTLGANLEKLALTGNAAVSGTGNELANVLYGHVNSAANVLAGGLGDDTYYAGVGDTVSELAGGGTDTVYSYGSFTLAANVERLYLNVGTAGTLTGNGLANTLRGNIGGDVLIGLAGKDVLDGREGADTMSGGTGDDRYYVDDVNDVVVELAGEGTDRVDSSVSWTLPANVERLSLTGSAPVSGTGNELANVLYGYVNSAANVLAGGLGNDTYYAGVGDTIFESAGGGTDTVYSYGSHTLEANVERLYLNVPTAGELTGNELANTLRGNAGGDLLSGLAGNDALDGGEGADTLVGGPGDDVLVGGGGNDRFLFDFNFGSDRIDDFTPGADLIQLSVALGFGDFAQLDTNASGTLDSSDAAVQIVGLDTFIDFGADQLQIAGQWQLQSSDFLFA